MKVDFLISCIVYLVYVFLRSRETIHMLQQNKYNAHNTYLIWLKNNIDKGFKNLSIIFLLLFVFVFYKNIGVLKICFNLIYIILIIDILSNKNQSKLPLKYTSRVKRLIFTNALTHILVILIMSVIFTNNNLVYLYIILGFIVYINSLYVLLAVLINTPIEKFVGLLAVMVRLVVKTY